MNGRKAKQFRRENTEEVIPELNMSYGPNRKQRRYKFRDHKLTKHQLEEDGERNKSNYKKRIERQARRKLSREEREEMYGI